MLRCNHPSGMLAQGQFFGITTDIDEPTAPALTLRPSGAVMGVKLVVGVGASIMTQPTDSMDVLSILGSTLVLRPLVMVVSQSVKSFAIRMTADFTTLHESP